MRLSPPVVVRHHHRALTTASASLFLASASTTKMGLLKENSTEKLNTLLVGGDSGGLVSVLADDCKELPILLMGKGMQTVRKIYDRTAVFRHRLLLTWRHNWLRMALSIMVLMAQFVWIASNFTPPPPPAATKEECLIDNEVYNAKATKDQPNVEQQFPLHQPDELVPFYHPHHDHPRHQPQPLALKMLDQKNFLDKNHTRDQRMIMIAQDQQLEIISVVINNDNNNNIAAKLDTTQWSRSSSPSTPPKSSTQSSSHSNNHWSVMKYIVHLLQRIIFLLKLATVLLAFELIRHVDTMWNVCCSISYRKAKNGGKNGEYAYDDDDDEPTRSVPKSPVDVGYIERNRGYK